MVGLRDETQERGTLFDFSYPGTPADKRGWGPGWEPGMPIGSRPASYPGEIVPLVVRGASFIGGIRVELSELAQLLIEESLDRGYIPNLMSPGCWGGAFRPTKRSDGTYTTTPSNHSWYTAIDINAPRNVFGASTHEIPQAMADLFKKYGWRWLGPPIKDWMHFDFAGSPADAKAMLAKAREELGVCAKCDALSEGVRAFLSDVEPTQEGEARAMFRALRRASERPQPGAHEHAGYAKDGHLHPHGHDAVTKVT